MSMNILPSQLPEIDTLRRRCIALAMLDAIICPEWEYRYFSFNPRWGAGEEMASMRNGEGDDWFLLFGSFGAALKGFAHESKVKSAHLAMEAQKTIPSEFVSFLNEPAFSMSAVSFCYWRRKEDLEWSTVTLSNSDIQIDDGSADFMHLLVTSSVAYQEFSKNYFERELSRAIIDAIYEHEPLTGRLVEELNPSLSFAVAESMASRIGYPAA
jgi:hypothetical protein